MVVDDTLTSRGASLVIALFVGLLLALFFLMSPSSVAAQSAAPDLMPDLQKPAPVVLLPHRAVYDLSLGQTRGDSQIAGVSGRIVYDFGGSACRGYSLDFRQVSELDTGEGKVSISDLRSTTWEGADAKDFKFKSQNYVDDKLLDTVDGHAEHDATETAVDLDKPEQKNLKLDPGVVFPTEHMVRAIQAARAGKTLLHFPVYDGSDSGDKVFNTLTVIGKKLAPDERNHDDAAAHEPKLAAVPRWPVTISYFDKSKADDSGEETPAYSIGFELYENGISRALTLDYNDFVVDGKLTSLEIKDQKPCP
ncbi:MAG: cell envelope integrity EipB family protein [Xanthobacteraceae bacterium]